MAQSALRQKGGEGREKGSTEWFPHGESPWSSPWLERRKAFQWEVRHGSIGESLSHDSSTAGLDEQRQSMVLELYCRKAGRKERREKERQRERGRRRREREQA